MTASTKNMCVWRLALAGLLRGANPTTMACVDRGAFDRLLFWPGRHVLGTPHGRSSNEEPGRPDVRHAAYEPKHSLPRPHGHLMLIVTTSSASRPLVSLGVGEMKPSTLNGFKVVVGPGVLESPHRCGVLSPAPGRRKGRDADPASRPFRIGLWTLQGNDAPGTSRAACQTGKVLGRAYHTAIRTRPAHAENAMTFDDADDDVRSVPTRAERHI